jgi:WD40 repeat protein
LSRDGSTAACYCGTHRIDVWDIENCHKKYSIATPATYVCNLEFSRDGTRLAAAGLDECIRLYDVLTGEEIEQIPIERFLR